MRFSSHLPDPTDVPISEDNLFGDVEELLTDWLDPPLEELLEVPGDPRLPTARFVARLDPPVVLPFQEEVEIYPGLTIHSVGRMDAILFPTLPTNPSVYRRVHHPEDPEGSLHRYTLHSDLKPVIARKVTEIPFSHPKDLLPIFRTLRQYALLTTLLESCFLAPGSSTSPPDGFEEPHVDELNTFLQDLDEVSRPPPALPVDITLEIEHAFGLRITAPGAAGGVENLQVRVGKNAELVVGAAEEGDASAKGVERALRACEDVGLVLAWMRRRKSEL